MSSVENLKGCDFDAATACALAGKDIIAMVTDSSGENLLSIAGQQGLSYEMSSETTEAATKDDENDNWSVSFHAGKSWNASVDGLWSVDDEASKMVAKALANSEYLCLKICHRIKSSTSVTYKPLRMGLAIVTTHSFDGPNDDNVTYSMEFQGTGKPWLIETATEEEIEAATITVTTGGTGQTGSTGSTGSTGAEG